jgi:hypothetical protein
MKLKSSPSGAPSRRRRRARSNSEFRFISRCPRMAEILAGESRNTRDRDGAHLGKFRSGVKADGDRLYRHHLSRLKCLGDYIQSLAATFGHLNAVKDKIPFRVRPMLATLVGERFMSRDGSMKRNTTESGFLPTKKDPRSRCSVGTTKIAPQVFRRLLVRSARYGLRPCCSTERSLHWIVTRSHASSCCSGESVVHAMHYSTVCV